MPGPDYSQPHFIDGSAILHRVNEYIPQYRISAYALLIGPEYMQNHAIVILMSYLQGMNNEVEQLIDRDYQNMAMLIVDAWKAQAQALLDVMKHVRN